MWRQVLTWEVSDDELRVGDTIELIDEGTLTDEVMMSEREERLLLNSPTIRVVHLLRYPGHGDEMRISLKPALTSGRSEIQLYLPRGWRRYFRKVS